jgi:recombination protein U
MQNAGKKFESAFKKSIPNYCLVYRLHDPPQSFNKNDGLRFSWKNPCDFFLFDDKNIILYTLELKSTKSKSISFEDINIDSKQPSRMIHKHQIESLIDYGKFRNVISGFLFNFRDENICNERTYFQSIQDFMNMYNSLNKRSFNEIDLIQSGGYTKVIGTKKRVNYTWDIDSLLTELSTKQFEQNERE